MSSFETLVVGNTVTLEEVVDWYEHASCIVASDPNVDCWFYGLVEHNRVVLDAFVDQPDLWKRLHQSNVVQEPAGRRYRALLEQDHYEDCLNDRSFDRDWLQVMLDRAGVTVAQMPRGYYPRWLDGWDPFHWNVFCNLSGYPVEYLAVGLNLTVGRKYVLVGDEALALAQSMRQDIEHWGVPTTHQQMIEPLLKRLDTKK